jgi:hypothetical protein
MRADDPDSRSSTATSPNSTGKKASTAIGAVLALGLLGAIASNQDKTGTDAEKPATAAESEATKGAVLGVGFISKAHGKLTKVQFERFIKMTDDIATYAKGTVINVDGEYAYVNAGNGIVVRAKLKPEIAPTVIKNRPYLLFGKFESVTDYTDPLMRKFATWVDPNFKTRLVVNFSSVEMAIADDDLPRAPSSMLKKGEDLLKQRMTDAFTDYNSGD